MSTRPMRRVSGVRLMGGKRKDEAQIQAENKVFSKEMVTGNFAVTDEAGGDEKHDRKAAPAKVTPEAVVPVSQTPDWNTVLGSVACSFENSELKDCPTASDGAARELVEARELLAGTVEIDAARSETRGRKRKLGHVEVVSENEETEQERETKMDEPCVEEDVAVAGRFIQTGAEDEVSAPLGEVSEQNATQRWKRKRKEGPFGFWPFLDTPSATIEGRMSLDGNRAKRQQIVTAGVLKNLTSFLVEERHPCWPCARNTPIGPFVDPL